MAANVEHTMANGQLSTIGEVAALTGVPVKTIRYYAEIGLLPPARTTAVGYRLYSSREIWRLELIRTLRDVGFGLEDIRRVLGGELTVAAAIDWQLRALDVEIDQLGRRREMLAQARLAHSDDERALDYLHALGTAVRRSADERGRLLTELLRGALGGDNVPPGWDERTLAAFKERLPAKPTAEQAAAWAELTELLNDPDTTAAMSAHVAPFWETMGQGQLDWPTWQRELSAVHDRAAAACQAGLAPDSEPVADIVRQWAGLFARMRGLSCDDDFLRCFGDIAPGFVDERSRRVHELMDRAGFNGDGPPELAIQQLLLDGLAAIIGSSR